MDRNGGKVRDREGEEETISPIDPYTAFRLMEQTRRALWAIQNNNPSKAFAILQRQLRDCERAIAEMDRHSDSSMKP